MLKPLLDSKSNSIHSSLAYSAIFESPTSVLSSAGIAWRSLLRAGINLDKGGLLGCLDYCCEKLMK